MVFHAAAVSLDPPLLLNKRGAGGFSNGSLCLSKQTLMGEFAQWWGTLLLAGSGAVKPRKRFTGDTTGTTIPIFSNRDVCVTVIRARVHSWFSYII